MRAEAMSVHSIYNCRRSRSRGFVFYSILELVVGHYPVRYDDIVTGERPRKTMPSPPVTNDHPPSLERQPADRPWCRADLANSS
jgi:hypothetical protein